MALGFGGVLGVDVCLLAGAGERDVGALAGRVGGDDQVRGVGGVALGGEWVLDVGEPQVGLVDLCHQLRRKPDLPVGEAYVAAVGELEIELARAWVDAGDLGGGAVSELSVFGMVDRVTDLHVVALS